MSSVAVPNPNFSSFDSNSWDQSLFSISVNKLLKEIDDLSGGADIKEVLEILFKLHSEYGKTSKPVKDEKPAQGSSNDEPFKNLISFLNHRSTFLKLSKFHAKEWADEILSIVKASSTPPIVHGRLFLIGTILFQLKEINIQFQEAEKKEWQEQCSYFIDVLFNELNASNTRENELTTKGKQLLVQLKQGTGLENGQEIDLAHQNQLIDNSLLSTQNLSDYPAQEDALSRKALAIYLAKRLRYIYERDIEGMKFGSFFMHIDGAWGSGKSTLLRFIEKELRQDAKTKPNQGVQDKVQGRWIVVNFNAWENQRLNSPWWSLMKAIYKESLQELWKLDKYKWFRLFFSEHLWRINTGTNYFWAVVVTLILFGAAIIFKIDDTDIIDGKFPFAPLITFAGVLWSFTKYLGASLVPGSAKAAQSFIEENGKDPMKLLAGHFQKQIKRTGYPMAIFIDDLDRCNKDYGIKLLEGLQTIFRQAPLVYVVAADRKWLSTMYEHEYSMFAGVIAKPTKPFGLVFLDKTFQLVVELPIISALQKKIYWNKLLNVSQPNQNAISIEELKEIKEEVQKASTNQQKIELAQRKEGNIEKEQAMREEVISNVSIREEETQLEHQLIDFVELLEPNPRAMKRLLNDISTANALSVLYNQEVDIEQLILWTILKQHHPALAELFWNHPELVDLVLQNPDDLAISNNAEYNTLLKKPEIQLFFQYQLAGKTIKLDANFFKQMKFL